MVKNHTIMGEIEMDYNKVKKVDLIKELEKRDKDAKDYDKLFAELRRKEKDIERREAKLNEEQLLNPQQLKRKENRIKAEAVEEVKKEHEEQIAEINKKHEKEIGGLKAAVAQLQIKNNLLSENSEIEERVTQLNEYMVAHGALLKTLQGALDTALIANEYLSSKVLATNQKINQE